jgi:hypothetical protein
MISLIVVIICGAGIGVMMENLRRKDYPERPRTHGYHPCPHGYTDLDGQCISLCRNRKDTP